METWRSAVTGIAVILLTLTLVSANLVTAGERTALNQDFVATALEEEGFYGEIQGQVGEAITGNLGAGGDTGGEGLNVGQLPISPSEVVNETITEEYLKSQLEPNIRSVYSYLHGEQGSLNVTIDLAPVKEGLGSAVEGEVANMSGAELMELSGNSLGGGETEIQGVTVDLSGIKSMENGSEEYRSAREDFRNQVRSSVVDRLVDQAINSSSDDQLLALVVDGYDPTAYSASEKEAMVEERRSEIRGVVRDRIRSEQGDEIDSEVESRMSELRDALSSEVNSSVSQEAGDADQELQSAMSGLLGVYVDGLTGDMSFAQFSSELETAKGEMASVLGSRVESSIAEGVPDEVNLTKDLGQTEMENLAQAQRVVGILDTLFWLLPLLAVLLTGAIFGITRSPAITLAGSGASLLVAGGSGLAASFVGRQQVKAIVSTGGMPPAAGELVSGVVGRVLDVLMTQSLLLALLGVALLGAGYALYRGLIAAPGEATE